MCASLASGTSLSGVIDCENLALNGILLSIYYPIFFVTDMIATKLATWYIARAPTGIQGQAMQRRAHSSLSVRA